MKTKEKNYANLNYGLDDEDVYSPPIKKLNRKGPGSYPSEERLRSHLLQNNHVRKKQKLTSDKEKELDLEKIMDDSDTLPDIVLNRPVPTADNECINHEEPPLNQLSLVASEEEVFDNKELGLTTPLTPNEIAEFAEAAVTAATENIMSDKSVHETTSPNRNTSMAMSETDDTNKESSVAAANQDTNTLSDKSSGTDLRTKTITIMNKENTNDSEKPPSLPLPEDQEQCNNENSVTKQKASTCIVDDTVTSSVTLGKSDTLSGVTEACNGVPLGINPNVSIGTYTSKEPMEVDINNEPNETIFGVTVTGNGVMVLLHGITSLNSLDHSYSRQTNDSVNVNDNYYATTEDEEDAIEGLLQLSAADNPGAEFPGDNSQLFPIGAHIPDVAPTDINIETAAVTAAIENIALEETVSKTTNTVSTQTTFTRQRHR